MSATLKLEVVTPDEIAYSADVEMVTLPGLEGQMGIYPQHVPLMTQIVPGELLVKKDGKEFALAVGEGFAEITGSKVNVLTDMAIKADADDAKMEEARKRAEARLRERMGNEDAARVEAAMAQSLSQIRVKRRKH
jgi:F-type H+-transporting ATPase subunit epsilon